MTSKSFDEIKEIVEKRNYVLTTKYTTEFNAKSQFLVKCDGLNYYGKKHTYTTTKRLFQQSISNENTRKRTACGECAKEKTRLDNYNIQLEKAIEYNFTLLTEFKDFESGTKTKLTLECQYGHIMDHLNGTGFNNRINDYKKKGTDPCKFCSNGGKNTERTEKFIEKIEEKLLQYDLEFIKYDTKTGIITYKCEWCNEEKIVRRQTLFKLKSSDYEWRGCNGCSVDPQKYTFEQVREEFKKRGFELLSTIYINNKTPLKYKCACGNKKCKISLKDLFRGSKCMKCKSDRTKETCIRLYGVDNVFKSEEIKKKIRELMLKKYGQECYLHSKDYQLKMLSRWGNIHPMRCPKLFHKMTRTSFSKKKFIFEKTKREVFIMGYEDIAIKYILDYYKKTLKLKEDHIIVGEDVKTFWYKDQYSDLCLYYPDFSFGNNIVEVKSIWTFNKDPERNYLKFCQVAKEGHPCIVLIYGNNKKLMDKWVFKYINGKLVIASDLKYKASKNGIKLVFNFNETLSKNWNTKCNDKNNEEITDNNDNEEINDDTDNEYLYEVITDNLEKEFRIENYGCVLSTIFNDKIVENILIYLK